MASDLVFAMAALKMGVAMTPRQLIEGRAIMVRPCALFCGAATSTGTWADLATARAGDCHRLGVDCGACVHCRVRPGQHARYDGRHVRHRNRRRHGACARVAPQRWRSARTHAAVAGAQSLAYVLDFGFTHTTLSWRLMLSVAAIPAVLQLFAMFHLPESPRWCARSPPQPSASSPPLTRRARQQACALRPTG